MNSATPKVRKFAQRLLALEAAVAQGSETQGPAFRVCDKLRRPLAKFAGVAGFRSLLTRALALAYDEIPWLKAVHVRADGSLEGLEGVEAPLSPAEIAQGEAVLITHLLALLVTFIGEPLTLHLVQEPWPEITSDDLS